MVLAEAEAGWKNWEGAVAALSMAGSDTAGVPGRLWYMLGVALQESGGDQGAAGALARFVESVPRDSSAGLAARSRLSRALAATGADGEAVDAAGELNALSPLLGDWTALATARTVSPAGEAEAVGELLAMVADPSIRRAGWRLEVDAWAASGDTARALEALAAGPGPAIPIGRPGGPDRRRATKPGGPPRHRVAVEARVGGLGGGGRRDGGVAAPDHPGERGHGRRDGPLGGRGGLGARSPEPCRGCHG